MRRIQSILLFLFIFCFYTSLQAEEIPLTENHPQRYTVVKGDTLWGIAARFLKNPWQWPEIWHANPQIKDPHWIYPGDVIVLDYVNGQPRLTLQRGHGVEKLEPHIRETPIEEAIPVIPSEKIRQFLTSPRVATEAEINQAPYIVSLTDSRIVGGAGDTIYVRGIGENQPNLGYTIFRKGKPFKDHKTKEVLGFQALYVAETQMQQSGDPATLTVTRSLREVLVGDRLLPMQEKQLALDYFPHAPETEIEGQIIDVLDGVSQIGQYNIVVIDRGTRDGLEEGHVLTVWRKGEKVRDAVNKRSFDLVDLPDEKAGLLLVFRPFERVSYGILMRASRAIHINDLVRSPEL